MIVKTQDLVNAVKLVNGLVKIQDGFGPSNNVYFEVKNKILRILVFNTLSKAQSSIPCDSPDISFGLPRKLALSFSTISAETSQFKLTENKLSLVGKARLNLSIVANSSSLETLEALEIEKPMVNMSKITDVARALSNLDLKDNQSWVTSGVHLVNDDQLGVEAIDKSRFLAIKLNTVSNSEKFDIIVPGHVIQVLKSIKDDVHISVRDNLVFFEATNLIFVTNTLTGKFPDFNKVIALDTEFEVTIDDVAKLKQILTNVKIFSEEVILDLKNNEISTVDTSDEYSEEFDFKTQLDLKLRFNVNNLIDSLLGSKSISFKFNNDVKKPFYIDCDDIRIGLMQTIGVNLGENR